MQLSAKKETKADDEISTGKNQQTTVVSNAPAGEMACPSLQSLCTDSYIQTILSFLKKNWRLFVFWTLNWDSPDVPMT